MKKLFVLSAFFISLFAACASGPKFSDVSGKNWQLIQVQVNGKNIGFDRATLVSEGFGDIFTLTFSADKVNGAGAPNRYVAPYSLGNNQAITIGVIAGTLMAPIKEPEKLKERDFFNYLHTANKWDLVNGNLQLSGKGDDGAEAALVFVLENAKKK